MTKPFYRKSAFFSTLLEFTQNIIHYRLLEVDYILPQHQKCQLEAQIKSFINDFDKGNTDDTTMTLGVSYQLTNDITLKANYIHDINLDLGREEDIPGFQLYYYGQ